MFYWPKLKEEVIEHVHHCDVCQLNKGEHILPPRLLEPIEIPDGAWKVITMDFVCGLPRSEGKNVILVVIDKLTKYCHLIALSHPFTAVTIAEQFLNTINCMGCLLKSLQTETPFLLVFFWKELMNKIGIKLNFSTAYHPQTDGQSEKLNQCIETYLRCMVFHNPKKWAAWLGMAEWWYNSNFHTAIQKTPFEALYGYPPPHFPIGSIPKGANPAVNAILADRQQAIHQLREQLLKAQARMKKWADLKRTERSFSVGDWVYLKLQPYRQVTIQGKGQGHKPKPKFYGPYEVITKVRRVAYELNLPAGSLIHPIFHVSQLKRKVGPVTQVHSNLPVMGPEGRLKVEPLAILNRHLVKKNNQAVVEVLIHWANMASEDATWESYEQLLKQFLNNCLEDKTSFKEGAIVSTRGAGDRYFRN
jgi:ribosomal protein L21E